MASLTVDQLMHKFVNCKPGSEIDSGSNYRVRDNQLTYGWGVRCKRYLIPDPNDGVGGIAIYAMKEGKWSNPGFSSASNCSDDFIRKVPDKVVIAGGEDVRVYDRVILVFSQKGDRGYNEWNRLWELDIEEVIGEWIKDREKVIADGITEAGKAKSNRTWKLGQLRSEINDYYATIAKLAGYPAITGIYSQVTPDKYAPRESWLLPGEYIYGGGSKRRKDGWLRAKVKLDDLFAERENKWNSRICEAFDEMRRVENPDADILSPAQIDLERENMFHASMREHGQYYVSSGDINYRSVPKISEFLGGDKFVQDWNDRFLTELTNKIGSIYSKDESDKIERVLDANTVNRFREKINGYSGWRYRLRYPQTDPRLSSYGLNSSFIHVTAPGDFNNAKSRFGTIEPLGTITTSQGVSHSPDHARILKLVGLKLLNYELTGDSSTRSMTAASYHAEVRLDEKLGKILAIGCHRFTEEHFRRQAKVWDEVMAGKEVKDNGDETTSSGNGGLGVGIMEGGD